MGLKDKVKKLATAFGEANPEGTNAFVPSAKIVELSQVANGVPVRTSDGSYRTYSKSDQNKAKKQLAILGAAPVIAEGIIVSAPVAGTALRTFGQAITPSTWIGGISEGLGYTAPSWILNGSDLALSAYFANEAGKEIDKNGLNLNTAINAVLSTTPLTREEQTIKAVANSVKSINDTVKKTKELKKFGKAFKESVKDTKFVNKPIEHVSENGVTEGAGLRSYSNSDVGFHFSPEGSTTTYNIQQATNAPFVRRGTWTYTNNTEPTLVLDKGIWTYNFNPEIYTGVNPGTTIAENAMALNQKGPNFTYTNKFEGKGNQSFMTTEPSFGIQLSKNVENPITKSDEQISLLKPKPKVTTSESLGQMILDGKYPVELDPIQIPQLNGNTSRVLTRVVPEEIVNSEITPHTEKIHELYNSNFYKQRLTDAGITNPEKQAKIIQVLNNNVDNVKYYSTSLPSNTTSAFTQFDKDKNIVVFNRTANVQKPLSYDIHHEVGGHIAENNISEIQDFNKSLINDWKDQLQIEYEPNKKALDYMFRIYPDQTWEGRGMLAPAIYQMKRQGLTGEQLLESSYADTDKHLDNFRLAMGDEWVTNILNKLLIATPIVYGRNNKQGSKSS